MSLPLGRQACVAILAVGTLLGAFPGFAAEKPLTNADVVKLWKLALGEDVVIAKINQAAEVDFRLESDDLANLKKAGVSSKVIAAMLDRSADRGHSCLNSHWFTNLYDARRTITEWTTKPNEERKHCAFGMTRVCVARCGKRGERKQRDSRPSHRARGYRRVTTTDPARSRLMTGPKFLGPATVARRMNQNAANPLMAISRRRSGRLRLHVGAEDGPVRIARQGRAPHVHS